MSEFRTIHEHIDAFREAMRDASVAYAGEIETDGKLRRIYVEGDRKGSRNGWYKFFGDAHPAGAFGTMKGDARFTWTAEKNTVRPLSREEREALALAQRERKAREAAEEAAKMVRAAERSVTMWDAAAPATSHPYLTRKGVKAHGLRVGEFWKERREDGKPYLAAKGALLIALKDSSREIVSLQAIFAEPIKVGESTRDKDFVYGGKKAGCWATIGAPTAVNGQTVILIGEGYATCASAHEAAGLAVVIAFDAGNLLPVAREVRRLMPEARLVFLADNDRWTEKPVKNPGWTKASEAAATVRGEVVGPEFQDLEDQPTDFNDLHAMEGLAEVRRQIMAVVDPQPEPPPPADEPPPEEMPEGDFDADGADEEPPEAPDDDDQVAENPYFKVLGHDRKNLYVYQHEKKMITARGEAEWSEAALTAIAPLHWWEIEFPAKDGMSKKLAVNWLQRAAFKRGFFDPDTLRGRGAWRDDSRFVFHFGNKLWVDGVVMDVTKIDSTFVYEQGRRLRLPHKDPLSSAEGKKVFETCEAFHWTRPASAILLAGYCALAPVSGALRWRPHIWITGGAGSGKTTLLNLVNWLMNGTALYAQGNSTEAGIRQTLRIDSRPVIFDESEQNNDKEVMRIQNILSLIRQSSTESDARTLKGTQGGEAMDFVIRSMFCLGSIQVGLKQQADIERISVLTLRPKREGKDGVDAGTASENWRRISGAMSALRADPDLPAKMLHRSLRLLPVTVQNIEVFAQAVAEKFGSQRDGDQYGTLLAGAWSLVSTKVATLEQARAMIDRYDWSDYLEGSETEESDKALAALMGRMVRVKQQDVTLYELTLRAAGLDVDLDINRKTADSVLRRYGLMVHWGDTRHIEDAHLLIASKHGELERLMEATPYASDLKGQLLRVAGAGRHPKAERFLGVVSRCVAIPLSLVTRGAGDTAPAELHVDDDEFGDHMAF